MKAYRVSEPIGIEGLRVVDLPEPRPGPGEVVVRVRATSLNYRDSMVIKGGYPRNDRRPVIPLSDGAGEVSAVGSGVTTWKVGDRVAANFMRDWTAGGVTETALRSSLGGGIDGMLTQQSALPAHSLVRIPDHLSFEQAATLPCAALTAWNALTAAGTRAGDTVLLLGTGGVSIFGLQLAKAMGARTIVTSSSDEKLATARSLGADVTINYRSTPRWSSAVIEATAGRGVDHVLEVGGPGTLEQSLLATRPGGTISLIGLLDPGQTQPSVLPALLNAQTIRGIYVGSVEMFEAMNRAISVSRLTPVIDRVFAFDQAKEAYAHLTSQTHTGKIVIRVD